MYIDDGIVYSYAMILALASLSLFAHIAWTQCGRTKISVRIDRWLCSGKDCGRAYETSFLLDEQSYAHFVRVLCMYQVAPF